MDKMIDKNTQDPIGYCKECWVCITLNDKIPGYDVFECQNCGHPNSIDDMWYTSEDQYEKAKLYIKDGINECKQ